MPGRKRWGRVALGLTVAALLLPACATPIGVKRVDAQRVHRSLTADALSTGNPSAKSLQALHRDGLSSAWRKDPAGALEALRQRFLAEPNLARLFALAELSFVHAERGGGAAWYRASAVYAYAYLFPGPEPGRELPDPFDPRLRAAANLYNRGLTLGLRAPGEGPLDLSPRALPLPFGTLVVEAPEGGFEWGGHRLVDFVPIAELEVRGLSSRRRQSGIGAPLAPRMGPPIAGESPEQAARMRWVPGRVRLACTLLLRLEKPLEALASGEVRGSAELLAFSREETVSIDGREIPVEFEPTAALAFSLADSPLWDLEIRGFLGRPVDLEADTQLVALAPYQRGRIPVVFVHGTASSPGRWAEMLNELAADPLLRARYAAWFFFYNTGNPILYSAFQLRQSLEQAVRELDPGGDDPALRQMVLVGHSQGGLLVKLQAVESGDRFWSNVSDLPLESLDFDPEAEALLRGAFFFSPTSGVRRVIFISTPHGGSFRAGPRVGNLLRRLVRTPGNVARVAAELFADDEAERTRRRFDRIPTSIDNMTPGSDFLEALQDLPLAPGITAHSIIPVLLPGPPEGQNDGVVAFESAHIAGVESERVVVSGHSVQGHPEAVAEVRRILLLHVGEEP